MTVKYRCKNREGPPLLLCSVFCTQKITRVFSVSIEWQALKSDLVFSPNFLSPAVTSHLSLCILHLSHLHSVTDSHQIWPAAYAVASHKNFLTFIKWHASSSFKWVLSDIAGLITKHSVPECFATQTDGWGVKEISWNTTLRFYIYKKGSWMTGSYKDKTHIYVKNRTQRSVCE